MVMRREQHIPHSENKHCHTLTVLPEAHDGYIFWVMCMKHYKQVNACLKIDNIIDNKSPRCGESTMNH